MFSLVLIEFKNLLVLSHQFCVFAMTQWLYDIERERERERETDRQTDRQTEKDRDPHEIVII